MSQGNLRVPWWRIQYTEEDVFSVAQAMRSGHVSLGQITAEFEEKLAEKLSVPYVIATTSGSAALLMALILIGIKSGDEVIIPNRTWIAAAHAVMMLGAKAVFVDVLPDIPNIDIEKIEEKITSRTRAIIPTPLNGRAVNIRKINSLAEKYSLHVVEDAAQALFSCENGAWIGTQAEIACFSSSIAKMIPTGQGGFLITKNQQVYRELREIRTHGVDNLLNCNFNRFGFNFRFTDLQASIGLNQLRKIDEKINRLNRIYQRYEEGLKGCSSIKLIPVSISQGELPLYVEVSCLQRESLIAFLEARQIQTKAFYPNLNRAAYFECNEKFINADQFEVRGLTLPCGPDQPMGNVDYVIETILDYEAKRNEHAIVHNYAIL